MTQEERQLLLKDICGRLPYGVRVLADIDKTFDGGCIGIINKIEPYVGDKFPELKGQYLLYEKGSLTPLVVDEVRPYLRPMSSMTEEEKEELCELCEFYQPYDDRDDYSHYGIEIISEFCVTDEKIPESVINYLVIDWLNEHHFDFRGLIEKSLAIVAPEDMYKTE